MESLRQLLKDMEKAARRRSVDDYYPLNVRFHDLLAQFTGNATLLATYRRLVNEPHLYRRETLEHRPDSVPTSTHEHLAIVEAVPGGRREGRARLLHDPRNGSRQRLHRTLDRPATTPPRPTAARRRK